jgi:hypothetical protein
LHHDGSNGDCELDIGACIDLRVLVVFHERLDVFNTIQPSEWLLQDGITQSAVLETACGNHDAISLQRSIAVTGSGGVMWLCCANLEFAHKCRHEAGYG